MENAEAAGSEPDMDELELEWTRRPASAVSGKYRRLQQLGRGRFGDVFLCQEVATERVLVLKSVSRRNLDAPARQEARQLLKLRGHPNIIRLHDCFEDGPERLALVMDFADGGDLAERIARAKDDGERIEVAELLHVFIQMAFALQHCHRRAVLHRDVKPANIFLTLQARALLTPLLRAAALAHRTRAHAATPAWRPLAHHPRGRTGNSARLYSMAAPGCNRGAHHTPFFSRAAAPNRLCGMLRGHKTSHTAPPSVHPPPPPPRARAARGPGSPDSEATPTAPPSSPQGIVRLGDFGIAKDFECPSALEAGAAFGIGLAGTPLYMSPEVMQGQPLGRPSDAWSLGACLYEMLALTPPFTAPCLPVLVRHVVLNSHPPLPEHYATEGGVASLVDGLLRKSAAERTTLEAALASPLCKPLVSRYRAKVLRRSLARETRLHEVLNEWSTAGTGGRKSAAHSAGSALPQHRSGRLSELGRIGTRSVTASMRGSVESEAAEPAGYDDAGAREATPPRARPGAGVAALQGAIRSLLGESGKLHAVARFRGARESARSAGARGERSDERGADAALGGGDVPVGDADASRAGAVAMAAGAQPESARRREQRALDRARRASMPFEAFAQDGRLDESRFGSRRKEKLARLKAATSLRIIRRPPSLTPNSGGGAPSSRSLAKKSVAATHTTYACTDYAGRPGQLWVSDEHICFCAAGGARVVIHLRRIDQILTPRSKLPGSRAARSLRIRLTATAAGSVSCEAFYGFTDRQTVVDDILALATRHGHEVGVRGGRASLHSLANYAGDVMTMARARRLRR